MNTKLRILIIVQAVITSVVFMGCAAPELRDTYGKASLSESVRPDDLDSLYSYPDDVLVLYLTVGRGKTEAGAHTWREINSHDLDYYEKAGQEIYECGALVQFGNEEGPTSDRFGYGDVSENATVRLTGSKASEKQQKSYRIKINKGSGNMDGMKTLILNKSFTDPFRFTDKLSFDLMRETDEMMSIRTRFVHLYVRDEYEGEELFTDYGLYTMMEPVNKKYLSNRSIDSTGELYKLNDFDFARHEDVILNPTDARYDQKRFEELLESKGSNDHTKLIKMLDALNAPDASIEDVVDTYFDKENLYSFMAFNLLTDNVDTDTENMYLYSPTGTDRFFIIPWDQDGALRSDYELVKDPGYVRNWEKGIYLYTDSKLFGSIVKSRHCVDDLSVYIAKYHDGVLSGNNVLKKALSLSSIIKPYIYELPDRTYARVTEREYDELISMLPEQMDNNYYAYYDSLETPWPFHIMKPENDSGRIRFSWEDSTVLEGDVTYKFELSNTWDFANVIETAEGLTDSEYSMDKLSEGQYFVRVRAVSSSGLTQEAYEFYNTEIKTRVNGVLCFYVLGDGTVETQIFEEQ